MFSDHETLCLDSTFLSNFLIACFFSSKIHKIHTNLLSHTCWTSHIPCPHTPPKFDFFMPASVDEISKLIDESNDTYCDLDPIPSSLLKKCKFALYFQLSPKTPISPIFLLLLVFFLINTNPAKFILSLRNLTVIKMTCLIIDPFLICRSFLN